MAKALLARPNVAALLVSARSRLFCNCLCSLACLQATKRSILLPSAPRVLSIDKPLLNSSIGQGGPVPVLCHRHRRRNFCIRATNEVTDSGSVDSTLIQSMEKKINEHLHAESVTVKDAYGDGRHVSIDVIASAFEGQSTLNRQRMVYKAIWEELQNTVHAVDQMTTRTPVEADLTK